MKLPLEQRRQRIATQRKREMTAIRKSWPGTAPKFKRAKGVLWHFESTIAARDIPSARQIKPIGWIQVQSVDGCPPKRKGRQTADPYFYAVRMRVAIQIEGLVRGLQGVEDRIVVLRARSESDARRCAERESREYGRPYLNAHARLVRWHVEEITDIYPIDTAIDPAGTEVYSSISKRRMRPEYEWHPFNE